MKAKEERKLNLIYFTRNFQFRILLLLLLSFNICNKHQIVKKKK